MHKMSRILMMIGAIVLFGLLMTLQQGLTAFWLRVLVSSAAGGMLGIILILAQRLLK